MVSKKVATQRPTVTAVKAMKLLGNISHVALLKLARKGFKAGGLDRAGRSERNPRPYLYFLDQVKIRAQERKEQPSKQLRTARRARRAAQSKGVTKGKKSTKRRA